MVVLMDWWDFLRLKPKCLQIDWRFRQFFLLNQFWEPGFLRGKCWKYHRKKYNMENAVRQNIVFRKLYLPSNWPKKKNMTWGNPRPPGQASFPVKRVSSVTIPTLARDALQTHKNDISWCTQNFAGWWFQPLWKIWKSVGLLFPIYRKNEECSKPPTRGGMVPKTLDFDWFVPSYQPFSIHIWIWTDAFLIAFRFGNN